MKHTMFTWLAMGSLILGSHSAFAAPFDYLKFAVNNTLKCAHSTVDASTAKAEYISQPKRENDLEEARVKIFYKGFTGKSHSMTVDYRLGQLNRQDIISADVLEDSALTGTGKCPYFRDKKHNKDNWQPVEN